MSYELDMGTVEYSSADMCTSGHFVAAVLVVTRMEPTVALIPHTQPTNQPTGSLTAASQQAGEGGSWLAVE
jgi:hypothetical protein